MTIVKMIFLLLMESTWLEYISPCLRPHSTQDSPLAFTSGWSTMPRWTEPLRVIYDHELVLFTRGGYAMEIGGTRHECPAGTFMIVPPGVLHSSWDAAGKSGYRYWSHFDWVYQGPHTNTSVMTFHPAKPRPECYRRAPPFVPQALLHGKIRDLRATCYLADRLCAMQGNESTEHDRVVSRALLLELLLELLDDTDRKKTTLSGTEDIASRARALLEQNVQDHSSLSIQDLLEERIGCSYEHVCRLFRAKYGIPPLKYLNVLCVSRAKLLLRDTNLPIADVAKRLGFRDPLYFSQLFRKMTGCAPSRYREKE